MKPPKVCPDCLRDEDQCICLGSYHGNDSLLKRKLKALGIDDAVAFVAQCREHKWCGLRPPEPVQNPSWYSQK